MSLIFLKVWDVTRKKKSLVYLNEDEEDLLERTIMKVSQKLDINGSSLVLERDGTPVDENIILKHFKNEIFILLEPSQQWQEDVCLSNITNISGTSTTTLIDSVTNGSCLQASNDSVLNNTLLIADICPEENFQENLNAESVSNLNTTHQFDCNQNFMWKTFQIPWEQFSKPMIESCERGERDKQVINYIIHTVVNNMRVIKKIIPSSAIKIITKKIIDKYPETFRDIDEDNVVIGDGSYSVFKKLQDRNNYLNRPHITKRTASMSNPMANKKQRLFQRAGCSHWDPPLPDGENVSTNGKMSEDNPDLLETLHETFPQQRDFLNRHPSRETIQQEWPILFSKSGALIHFHKLTNSDLTQLGKKAAEKLDKFLKLHTPEENNETSEYELLTIIKILARYFKENLESIYMEIDNIPNSEDLQLEPLIMKIGTEENNFFVYYEKGAINQKGFSTFNEAFQIAFSLYFNLNLKYPSNISLTMEFVQRYFLKIHPDSGTKSRSVGLKRVINLMNKMKKM
ncbi:uncharacterized protein [Leptinotarsa decemlineata]|uniref:uncharacterized protein n=1 Tax=Leptinotarsa decemlineata TaxID=7539 RepID=UPI003D30A328